MLNNFFCGIGDIFVVFIVYSLFALLLSILEITVPSSIIVLLQVLLVVYVVGRLLGLPPPMFLK